MINSEVIVAIITGVATVVAVVITNKKSNALIAYRLEQLENKVDKHNKIIERTFKLEEKQCILEEKLKVANHRIEDLERR